MAKYTTLSEEFSQLSRERQETIQTRASEIYFEEVTRGTIEIIVRLPNQKPLIIGN